MGIVRGSETDFSQVKKIVHRGKEIAVQKKLRKGRTGFTSAHNTRETYGARSHAAIAHLGRIIMNTVTFCYSCGLATGLNTVILPCFCTMFWLRKSKCYKSWESTFSQVRFQSFSFELFPMPDKKESSCRMPA